MQFMLCTYSDDCKNCTKSAEGPHNVSAKWKSKTESELHMSRVGLDQ